LFIHVFVISFLGIKHENTAFPIVTDPSWWQIAKCAGAINVFIGTNMFAISKIMKIKE